MAAIKFSSARPKGINIVVGHGVGRRLDVDATARGAGVFLDQGDFVACCAPRVENVTVVYRSQDFVERPPSRGLVWVITNAHGDNMSLLNRVA